MSQLQEIAPPPRTIPLFLRIKVLLGGILQQFGWFFFCFGMVFMVVFIVHGQVAKGIANQMAFKGDIKTTQGVITYARETSASEDETEIVLYGFEFKLGEETLGGENYFTGWEHDKGDKVTIEYLAEDPLLCRIKDGRWSLFGIWLPILLSIFPFMGLLMVGFGLPQGVRGVKLLQRGRVAQGTLVSKEPTGGEVNEQPICALTFKFKAESTGRDHLMVVKTHNTEPLEDEEQEALLYLPSLPEYAVLFDALPGSPRLNNQGQIEGGSFFGAIAHLLCPVLGLVMTYYVIADIFHAFSS